MIPVRLCCCVSGCDLHARIYRDIELPALVAGMEIMGHFGDFDLDDPDVIEAFAYDLNTGILTAELREGRDDDGETRPLAEVMADPYFAGWQVEFSYNARTRIVAED